MTYGKTYDIIIINIDKFHSKLVCLGVAQVRPNYTLYCVDVGGAFALVLRADTCLRDRLGLERRGLSQAVSVTEEEPSKGA